MKIAFAIVAVFWSVAATAQTAPPQAFPEDSAALSAEALQAALSGRVYDAKIGDGSSWRLDFKSSGYYFINTSRGYSDSGKWRIEDSKLCTEPKKTAASCNEIRGKDKLLYLKRDSRRASR